MHMDFLLGWWIRVVARPTFLNGVRQSLVWHCGACGRVMAGVLGGSKSTTKEVPGVLAPVD